MPGLRFAGFELQPAARQLLANGEPQRIVGRAFDLLVYLAEHRERVVPKSELLERVWAGVVVEENNLAVHVMTLRRLLGPQAIATVPGRGYRFTADVDAGQPLLREGEVAAVPLPVAAPSVAEAPILIGREVDRDALDQVMAQHRLVTLLGAGGVGKSVLARVLLRTRQHLHAHGAAWVDLTPVTEPAGVVGAIAAATRAEPGRRAPRDALAAALAGRDMLLVIDNAEHLVDEVTAVARALLDAAPALRLLVTSQVPLRLVAEQVQRLEPLALPDPGATLEQALCSPAVRLFVTRVRRNQPRFALDVHHLDAVVSLTRRLDGLPLAIEMAAARVPILTPAQVDAALDQRFRLLTLGDRSAPARQHSLQATLQWTHGLLRPQEQAVYRRLAIFAGSFALPAAQAAAHSEGLDAWQVLDAMAILVDCSLLTLQQHDPPRYRLLDTPRADARRRLAEAGEEAEVAARHLQAMVDLFSTAHEDFWHARRAARDWLDRLAPDLDDGLQALDWARAHDPARAVALAPGLAQACARRHGLRQRIWRQTDGLVDDDMPPRQRALWLTGSAKFWTWTRPQWCLPRAQQAAELFAGIGDAVGEYRALSVLASATATRPTDAQRAALLRMQAIEDPAWSLALRVLRLFAQATQAAGDGDFETALQLCEECVVLDVQAGRDSLVSRHVTLCYLEVMAGRFEAALARGLAVRARVRARNEALSRAAGELVATVAAVDMFATLAAVHLRRFDVARQLAAACWPTVCQFDQQAPVACTLALLAATEGRMETAAQLLGYAEQHFASSGVQRLDSATRPAEQARRLAIEALGAPRCEALMAEGATLTDTGAVALALAACP